MYISIAKLPVLRPFWQSHPVGYKHPLVVNSMPRNRFEEITRLFQFFDTEEVDEQNQTIQSDDTEEYTPEISYVDDLFDEFNEIMHLNYHSEPRVGL